MKCEVCGQGPMHGTTVYRSAPKGGPAHWRCAQHLPSEAQPSPEVAEIVAQIEAASDEKRH